MIKRLTSLLLALLLLLPAMASAELTYEREEKKYINFPEMDQWRGHFTKVNNWTIVTADTLEDHMELLLARGDSEEEIRTRFAQETLLFEAYSPDLPQDACFRAEKFEDAYTREIWHLRHLSTAERKTLIEEISGGYVLENYDVYSLKSGGSGGGSYLEGWFTNYPPAVHESGKIQLHYRNGALYVFTYNVRNRMTGRSSYLSNKEKEQLDYTPLMGSSFKGELLPRLTSLTLDDAIPAQMDVGELTLSGSVEKGGALTVTLDGKPVDVDVSKKGTFTLSLKLISDGNHEVVMTATHSKYTDRVETFTIDVSSNRTPMMLTAAPDVYALAGPQTVAGVTDPGTTVTLQLDEGDNVVLTADTNGEFTHTFDVMDAALHVIRVAAIAPGKDMLMGEIPFITEYESVKDGIKEFQKKLTEYTVAELAADPEAHIGERVKISVRVKDVIFTEEGLGIVCNFNPPNKSKQEKTPLYLTFQGYAQDLISAPMIMTIYGTVQGEETVQTEDGEETRLNIFVEYGTYLK